MTIVTHIHVDPTDKVKVKVNPPASSTGRKYVTVKVDNHVVLFMSPAQASDLAAAITAAVPVDVTS